MTTQELTDAQVLDMDAHAVLEAYRAGRLTPGRAVEIYIAHQQRFNTKLNLVVEDRYEQARAEAKRYDQLLAEGKVEGRLFGVPMSMKESIHVGGMHTTGGVGRYRDQLIDQDGEAVKRLRREGAIIMDKTNTPPFCFCQETDNLLFGRSNNPWNPALTTGGSSGGEAALIAVGGAAAGFGSDIGGSIRIPSHFNGVIGFKPGAHQSQLEGSWPPAETDRQWSMLGLGPIVKSVRDASLIYSIVWPTFTPPESNELPADLRVISFGDFHQTKLGEDTGRILQAAQQALREGGAELNSRAPEFMHDVALAWQLIMSEDKGEGINALAYPGRSWAFLLDYFKAKLGLEAEVHPYLSWAIAGTKIVPPSAKQLVWLEKYLTENSKKITELLGSNGVFVVPSYPTPAKPHGKVYSEIFSLTMSYRKVLPFITLANTFGLPAMVVPCGRSADGLPIGLQVISTVGNEPLLFRVAAFLEGKFGGWQRCRSYDG